MRNHFWSPKRRGLANRNLQRSLVEVTSVVLVATGVLLWLEPLEILHDQTGNVVRTGVLVDLLLYVFFAVGLTIAGLAFYVYSLHAYKTGDNSPNAEPSLTQLEFFLEPQNQMGSGSGRQTSLDTKAISEAEPRRFPKTYLLAFVEAAIVFGFYGALVTVYDATPSMRDWVAVNAPWAGYLLNDTTLALLLGVFFGVLLSELRAVRRKKWKLLLRMWRTLR
jgi:hypothetical protein